MCGQGARDKLEARDKLATCSEVTLHTAHRTVGFDPLLRHAGQVEPPARPKP